MAEELTSPRFQSDVEEEASEKKSKDFVKEELSNAQKWAAAGVDVDKRMLDGRKANRGFTIAMGKTTAAEDASVVRKDKRAQTLPAANMRRGDHILSAEAQENLFKMNETLKARYRRGSVTVAVTILNDDELKKTWQEHTTCHVHGVMTEGQSHGDEREREFFGADKLPGELPPIISCHKGSKGFRDTTPNQDNFSVTFYKNGWALACAFDGHGPFGHIVSTRTVQTVPHYFAHSDAFAKGDIKNALIEGFEKSQRELVAHALENGWDVQASGSTAVACCWKDDVVWTANAGDSRCVVGTETKRQVVFETEDHKPNTPSEKERIEASGGEVRTQTYPDGWVNHRIFVKGEDYPGLCMAPTLGDESVKAHGVIATPECATVKVQMGEAPFILLASDGVWEFLDSEFVIKAVAKKIKSDGPERTVQKLQREAKKRWKQEEGDYCDDITSILIQLGPR
jgi:serine/threonine protein phosphatase PrpC